MKPCIDLTKEYGLVLEGGGAKGAYQIGAWKALREAGVKVRGVAGTSVGALNGAFICMDDIEGAQNVWENITYSRIMSVDDEMMNSMFRQKMLPAELFRDAFELIKGGGVDITPLKELIAEYIDEDKIFQSPIALYILTYDMDERKELDLDVKQFDKSLLKDFLLASAYIYPLFKNEKLHGKMYIDGGAINNVPLGSLIDREYKDIIVVRIFGIGREKKVKIPDGTMIYTVAPTTKLGSILDFDPKKTKLHMKLGYYDTMRLLYGLAGKIYYIDESKEECYYLNQLTELDETIYEYLMEIYHLTAEPKRYCRNMTEIILPVIAEELKLSKDWTYRELYLAMLEATARLCRISKYRIFTLDELVQEVYSKLYRLHGDLLPAFVQIISKVVFV